MTAALKIARSSPRVDRTVLWNDLSWDDAEGCMEFRLTYAGPLLASNGGRDSKPARKKYKQTMRRHFHSQLKRLFDDTPFLATGKPDGKELRGVALQTRWKASDPPQGGMEAFVNLPRYDRGAIIAKHRRWKFNFLPLITTDLKLACWLDVLYLRCGEPGGLWHGGDIDNRLKTLFDTLTIPDVNQEYQTLTPQEDEDPFYCLLEDDKLISKVTVETDRMFEDIPGRNPDKNDARLVITVRTQPFEFTLDNLVFT